MTSRNLAIADIVIASFPDHQPPGREQQGSRPAIVVGFPAKVQPPRYPVVLVVPITSDKGQLWATKSPRLYPKLKAGTGNLPNDSIILLDQIRALDESRLGRYLGKLTPEMFQPIKEAVLDILEANERLEDEPEA
jgi:mRNA interferase MazF